MCLYGKTMDRILNETKGTFWEYLVIRRLGQL